MTVFFGDDTEKSLNVFQDYAIKENRIKRKVGKIETTDKKLEQAQPDGVYGKKTHDELTCWVQNDWIKPILTIRHGEFDQNGVNGIDRKPESDNFHSGNPVLDAQKYLQSVDAYKGFAMDGWFHDFMLEAVQNFQEAAEKGMFIVNGKPADISEKLTDHQKGVLCPKTQEFLQKVVDKGGMVSNEIIIIPMRFPLEAKYNILEFKTGERAFGSSRNHGKRAHAGCDLYAPVGEKIYAVADGVITRYHNFYGQTYALEIDHGTFTVRYGEVQPPKTKHGYENDVPPDDVLNGLPDDLVKGASVTKGQHIAYIGQLRLDKDKNGRLHNIHVACFTLNYIVVIVRHL
jgi:hypothetical protein